MSHELILTFSRTSVDPAKVIRFHYEAPLALPTTGPQEQVEGGSPLQPGTILVSFLCAPVNPQDLMVIAGRYPVKPENTYAGELIPGYDGVACVSAVGPPAGAGLITEPEPATLLRPGDLVIPRKHGLGTWRRHAVLPIDALMQLPTYKSVSSSSSSSSIDLAAAAMLRTVFVPAYLLVEDMRTLRPGDWIVQNAGASAIAQLVVQFAQIKGVNVVSVVRDHNQLHSKASTPSASSGDGANASVVILTESELTVHGVEAHQALAKAARQGRIVLALDAVFGESGERLAGLLSHGGTFVNFGSLGGADGTVRLTQKLLFWDEIRFRNFRLSSQLGLRSEAEQEALLAWFVKLIAEGRLHAPVVERILVPKGGNQDDIVAFEAKFKGVLDSAANMSSGKGVGLRKHILDFNAAEGISPLAR